MLCTRPSAESARHLIPYYVSIGGDRAALITKHAITLSALTNTHTRTLQPPRDVQVSRSLRRYMHIMCARCGAKHTMNLSSSSSTRRVRGLPAVSISFPAFCCCERGATAHYTIGNLHADALRAILCHFALQLQFGPICYCVLLVHMRVATIFN